jgi:signal peptidase I
VPRLRRIAAALAVLALTAATAALLPLRTVTDSEMAWSLQPGDRVWVVPDRVRRADIVLVADPLDPERLVLRRAIANGGQKVLVDEQGVRVNGKRIRQQEMGEDGRYRVLKEVIWSKPPARANAYLPQIADQPGLWSMDEPVEVPEGHWFLLADNRDVGIDSRWWGPVPEADIRGVVRARWSDAADTWRPARELLLPEE